MTAAGVDGADVDADFCIDYKITHSMLEYLDHLWDVLTVSMLLMMLTPSVFTMLKCLDFLDGAQCVCVYNLLLCL